MTTRARADARGLVGPTAGYTAIGLSAFLLLASGPRLLGADEYSLLAVSWTILTIFGFGLAFPAEQTVTTIVAGGGPHDQVRRILRIVALVAAALVVLPLAALVGANHLLGDSVLWSTAILGGAVAWTANVVPRGMLSGAGRFHAYGLTQVGEAVTRILLCALAWVLPQPAVWLAAALVLPLVTSAVIGYRRSERPEDPGARPPDPAARVSSFGAIVVVAVSFQLILNAAALVIQWRLPGQPAGEYVSAMTYMRIPMLLTGGFMTVVLSSAALAWASANSRALNRALSMAGLGALTCLAATVGVWLVSSAALTVFYGSTIEFERGTLALLGIVVVLAVTANLLTQIGLGAHRQRAMAVIWGLSAVVSLVLLWVLPTSELIVTVAILVGLMCCIVPTLWLVVRLRADLART